MTPEERHAYVCGALTVCMELHLQEHIVVELCQNLNIVPEELEALAREGSKERPKNAT
jgi:hypothetical protein